MSLVCVCYCICVYVCVGGCICLRLWLWRYTFDRHICGAAYAPTHAAPDCVHHTIKSAACTQDSDCCWFYARQEPVVLATHLNHTATPLDHTAVQLHHIATQLHQNATHLHHTATQLHHTRHTCITLQHTCITLQHTCITLQYSATVGRWLHAGCTINFWPWNRTIFYKFEQSNQVALE